MVLKKRELDVATNFQISESQSGRNDGEGLLTNFANQAVMKMMEIGCHLKFIPYHWDNTGCCLLHAKKLDLVVFYLHELAAIYMGCFAATRFVLSMSAEVPDRIRTINLLWTLAYTLEFICLLQFNLKYHQIKFYANSLFSYMNRRTTNNSSGIGILEKAEKRVRIGVSALVLMGIVMLIGNPPSHCIMVIDTPCAPHFVSSMFLPCARAEDNSATFLEKLPYIVAENYLVTVMFYLWTFNWIMIFLGLAWLKMELMKMRIAGLEVHSKYGGLLASIAEADKIPKNYRALQMITVLLNDGFKLYLTWFPSILLGIVALLIFAVIKFWDLNVLSYVMFPSCGLRCIFESITPLALAGFVNEESVRILGHWKDQVIAISERVNRKWLMAYQRSCGEIRCTAGSFYTFENSIVLTTISNCFQLTCNLLLTYR